MIKATEIIVMHDKFMIGTWVARYFGLGSRYFSQISRRSNSTLDSDIEIKKFEGTLFVAIPAEVRQYIKDGFIAFKIEEEKDMLMCEYIFELTRDTRIGFYK